jgi:hypothetical protein
MATPLPTFDPSLVPFSRPRSFLKLTSAGSSDGRRLRIASARNIPFIDFATKASPTVYYEIALVVGGREVPYECSADPTKLVLRHDRGEATFAFADEQTLVFSARGVEVRLLPTHSVCTLEWREPGRECAMVDYRGLCFHQARAAAGTKLTVTESLTVAGETGPYADKPRTLAFSGRGAIAGALRFSRHGDHWGPMPTVASATRASTREWAAWARRMPRVPERFRAAATAAWHILWSSEAPIEGNYPRRPLLMSKQWMNQVWSWDNCFNALAVVEADPELALDQLRLFIDRQSPTGAFPEPINEVFARYGYVKPPVWGWTATKLLARLPQPRRRAAARELYTPIARATEWWYDYRDLDGDGLCEYHHGNDSGWDNSTAFDQGYPTAGADLSAHLVLQCEGLARMATLLGDRRGATRWSARAKRQLRAMLAKQVRGDRFVSPRSGGSAAECASLLNLIPMVLGSRLPERIRRALVTDLGPGGPFLTDHGLASESPQSRKYQPNGYWRGPIWSPPTMLIVDGLIDAGETALAATIAERFCALCARDGAMWENYDALTGKGLCCPAYTWTAAVFIELASWLAAPRVAH